jgi:hypothetical protein
MANKKKRRRDHDQPAAPPASPWAKAVPILIGVLLVVRLLAGWAKEHNAEEQRRVAQTIDDITHSPQFTCDMDCQLATHGLGDPQALLGSADPACVRTCTKAKEKMPNIDFPATYRRCQFGCQISAAARGRKDEAGGPDAGRDAGATRAAAAATDAGAPRDEGAKTPSPEAMAACVDTCLDTRASGKQFDPLGR